MRGCNVRYLVAVLFVILLSSSSALNVSASGAATGHGCASPVPPAIPGSPAPAPAVSGIILINEVLLSPHSTWNCSETPGTYFITTDSWIELYNTQNQPFNLYAAHAVIDSGPNTNLYYFPFGASIAAHGFLVIFPRTSSSFTSTETSTLRLVIAHVVIDQVSVPTLGPDQSYARTSDGNPGWEITGTPTIDASNTSLQVTPTTTTSSSSSSSTGGGSSTATTKGSSIGVLVNGVQPRWSTLQFPAASPATPTTPTPAIVIPTTSSSSLTPSPTNNDLPRRIALTVSLLALALTLFWCWRLFKRA